MNASTKVLIVVAAGLAAFLGLRYGAQRLGSTLGSGAAALADLFNPASSGNLAYRGANTFAQAATNDPYATLGTALWRWTNPAALTAEARAGFGSYDHLAGTRNVFDNEDADVGLYMREADLSNPAGPSFWGHMSRGGAGRSSGATGYW